MLQFKVGRKKKPKLSLKQLSVSSYLSMLLLLLTLNFKPPITMATYATMTLGNKYKEWLPFWATAVLSDQIFQAVHEKSTVLWNVGSKSAA